MIYIFSYSKLMWRTYNIYIYIYMTVYVYEKVKYMRNYIDLVG